MAGGAEVDQVSNIFGKVLIGSMQAERKHEMPRRQAEEESGINEWGSQRP